MAGAKTWSKSWTFFEGEWHEGNVPILGARSHAAWAGSSVFDGARRFEGVTPDLDLHCARVNQSAANLYLMPLVTAATWAGLARDGIARFDKNAALYIRPMYWAEQAGFSSIVGDPDSTRFLLTIYESPMPDPAKGSAITLSPFRRPTLETAPVDAKAGCLYPNNAKALIEARSRGFDNCLLCDALGHVAETANSNIFMVKEHGVFTPAPNGTFLDGITRRRVIALLREAGVEVIETSLRYRDFETAEEIFTTGNYGKVLPVTRIDDRLLPEGHLYQKARLLYWEYAHGSAPR